MYDFSDSHDKDDDEDDDDDDEDIITVLISIWRVEHRACRNVMLLHPKADGLSIKMHRKTERHQDKARSQSRIQWAPCFPSDPAQQAIWFTHSSCLPHALFLINQLALRRSQLICSRTNTPVATEQ